LNETIRSSTLRPEDELLLCCARAELDPKMVGRVRSLAEGDIDWSYLSWCAEMHGVVPLVYWHLDTHCRDAVPRSSLEALASYFLENVRSSTEALTWLLNILRLFADAEIAAVPIRGPSVAVTLYPQLGLKQLSDIQLLVRKQDLRRANALLRQRGCSPAYSSGGVSGPQERAFVRTRRGHLFYTRDVQVAVELRSEVMPSYFRVPIDVDRIWQRVRRTSLFGEMIEVLPIEYQILLLCLDGAQHLWNHLATLCDIAELIRRDPDFDWNRLTEVARSEHCSSVVFLGLSLANERLGLALPLAAADEVRSDRSVRSLAASVRTRPFTRARRSAALRDRVKFHLPLRERLADKLAYGVGLVAPSPDDAAVVPLPRVLDFLYYLVRPVRFTLEQLRLLKRARPRRPRWSATPPEIVDRMLKLANVGPADLVYDLGCGEGRIVIHAAKYCGARGVGVDVDPSRIYESQIHALKECMQDLVRFERLDGFDADLRSATVVAVSMTAEWNDAVARKLQRELPSGARIVSWNTDFAGWPPQKVDIVIADGEICRIYMWEIDHHRSGGSTETTPLRASALRNTMSSGPAAGTAAQSSSTDRPCR
jgi:hypothetical protein